MVENFSVFFFKATSLNNSVFIINNFVIYYKDYVNHKVKSLQ